MFRPAGDARTDGRNGVMGHTKSAVGVMTMPHRDYGCLAGSPSGSEGWSGLWTVDRAVWLTLTITGGILKIYLKGKRD